MSLTMQPTASTRLQDVQIAHHAGVVVPDPPRILKVVNRLGHLPPGDHVDIGYSRGSFADYLIEKGWKSTALDINEHNDPRIETIRCDLNQAWPLPNESVDLI